MNNMTMRKLHLYMYIGVLIWILLQVVFVLVLNDMRQWPDSAIMYEPHALWHFQHGTFYPTVHDLHDNYIQSLGYINYLIIMLRLTDSFLAVMFANIIMNLVIVSCIYYIGKRFYNEHVAVFSVLLYCMLLSNVFIPIYIMSDLPSLFFSLTGFCLALNKRWHFVILGAVLLGVSHTFRSYELAFIISLVLFYIARKVCWYRYLLLFLPYLGVICLAGAYCKSQTGEFVTSSTTNGFALIKVALGDGKNDAGNGIFYDKSSPIYQGLPDSYTFAQKDSIWKERAKPGMKKVFVKHILYWPYRVVKFYVLDTFFIPSTVRFNKNNLSDEERRSTYQHKLYQIAWMWNNMVYGLVFLLFFVSLYMNCKSFFSEKGIILLVLLIMSFGFNILIAEERYHYPCVFLLCIWAAYGIDTILKKKKIIVV